MLSENAIPIFTLFGETENFPDIIHCETYSARAPLHDWQICAHRHAQMAQLFLVFNGQVDAKVDGHSMALTSNQYLFVPAMLVHEFTFEPNTDGQVISIPMSVIKSMGPKSDVLLSALSTAHTDRLTADICSMTRLITEACDGTSLFRSQRVVGLVHAVLASIAESAYGRTSTECEPANQKLQRLNQLINQHMADGWGASHYAAAMSISTGHLSRLCRQATSLSATAYIAQVTMEEACRLLAFTQLPVSQVGYRLGYADPSYFSRRFREARQLSPSDYRELFTRQEQQSATQHLD